jgi:DNA repair protein NreA
MNIRCIKCKGRDPSICGRTYCPIMAKISSQKKVNISAKQDFFGKSPNVFVGRHGYPDVNVGILGVEEYHEHDNPLLWSKENYDIARIIDLRSSLVNSNFKAQITGFKERFLNMSQEISMAKDPVDVEVNLSKKPVFDLSFAQDTMPHGPSIKLKTARITENPKIPQKVDKAVGDTDLKAGEALKQLHKSEFDEHYLTKLLSTGNLGVKTQRKLVPTRFAITAVDSNLGNDLVKKIKEYNQTGYLAFFGGYLGNYFLILLFPEVYSYELFETYAPNVSWNISEETNYTTDYEPYDGRKSYAENCAGGFYACRFALLEKLSGMKRQASCLCLRFITGDYYAPLGVWVVREAVRKALANKPIEFSSKELMLTYVQSLAKKKFGYDVSGMLQKSIILNSIKTQKKLNSFL